MNLFKATLQTSEGICTGWIFQTCTSSSPYCSRPSGQKAEKDTNTVNQLLIKANEDCQDLPSVY